MLVYICPLRLRRNGTPLRGLMARVVCSPCAKRTMERGFASSWLCSAALSKPEGEALSGCWCECEYSPLGVIPRLDRGTHHPNAPTRDGLHGQAVQGLKPEERLEME